MRFLADMCVAKRVVEWMRSEGHDVSHLREEGLYRLPNGAIFEKVAAEKRILITFDLDFGEIVALSGNRSVSVLLLRLRNTITSHVVERLGQILKESKEALNEGAIVIVEENRYRIRRLPLGA